MTAAYLPSILVPIIGIIFPGFVMAFAFMYIEQDEIAENLKVAPCITLHGATFRSYKDDPTPE
jgi:photosystem I subunit VIII